MPGENCKLPGCNTSRKHGISILKVKAPINEKSKEWRAAMLNAITKYREVDASFRKQILSDKVYICEKHFEPDSINKCKFHF